MLMTLGGLQQTRFTTGAMLGINFLLRHMRLGGVGWQGRGWGGGYFISQQQQEQQETVAGEVGNWFEAAAVGAIGVSSNEHLEGCSKQGS
jgi:hypothetical protein